MRRLLIALLAVLATVLGSATLLAGPASAEDSTTSCTGVLSGQAGDENLADKSLVSMVDNGNGTYTFTYSVYVDRAPGSYRIRDCIWIDSDGNGAYNGETLVGSDEKDVDFVADGAGSSGETTYTITASPDDTVCDRAAVSGTDASAVGFTDKSNILCVDISSPPVIPEASLAILLPVSGALVAVGFFLWRRRASGGPALAA